ncbi:MAG TPA: sigma-70 family RNA polymerase sigma factor [Balneolales bacterium]|nr:sigma-70 family RNA polymerase sigma factor [Balneolales bacterium]
MSESHNPSDKELLERIRNKDEGAFRLLIERYESQVAATVLGMLGNRADAEDIGQEIFIRFYKSIEQFRGESSLGTYLTRIAINLSLNELKRRERKNRRFLFIGDHEEKEQLFQSGETDELEQKELRELIQEAINKLKPEFKAVVILRMIQDYSTNETAEILNIPIGTVLSRYSRAIDKLKILLTPYIKNHEINL